MNNPQTLNPRSFIDLHCLILRKSLCEILTVLDTDHDYILAADMLRQLLGIPATKEGGDA